MRLYLSSFRLGCCPERLVALAGDGRRLAVVANAMDAQPPAERRTGVAREVTALAALGFAAEELDLRTVTPATATAALARFDVVWLRGGNVFVLADALHASGAGAVLAERLAADDVVYAGYSAGPCVLAPTLAGLDAVDPPGAVVAASGRQPTMAGLGVLDRCVVPHVASPNHPASAALAAVAARYARDGVDHVALRDGEVLVVDGPTETIQRPPTS